MTIYPHPNTPCSRSEFCDKQKKTAPSASGLRVQGDCIEANRSVFLCHEEDTPKRWCLRNGRHRYAEPPSLLWRLGAGRHRMCMSSMPIRPPSLDSGSCQMRKIKPVVAGALRSSRRTISFAPIDWRKILEFHQHYQSRTSAEAGPRHSPKHYHSYPNYRSYPYMQCKFHATFPTQSHPIISNPAHLSSQLHSLHPFSPLRLNLSPPKLHHRPILQACKRVHQLKFTFTMPPPLSPFLSLTRIPYPHRPPYIIQPQRPR